MRNVVAIITAALTVAALTACSDTVPRPAGQHGAVSEAARQYVHQRPMEERGLEATFSADMVDIEAVYFDGDCAAVHVTEPNAHADLAQITVYFRNQGSGWEATGYLGGWVTRLNESYDNCRSEGPAVTSTCNEPDVFTIDHEHVEAESVSPGVLLDSAKLIGGDDTLEATWNLVGAPTDVTGEAEPGEPAAVWSIDLMADKAKRFTFYVTLVGGEYSTILYDHMEEEESRPPMEVSVGADWVRLTAPRYLVDGAPLREWNWSATAEALVGRTGTTELSSCGPLPIHPPSTDESPSDDTTAPRPTDPPSDPPASIHEAQERLLASGLPCSPPRPAPRPPGSSDTPPVFEDEFDCFNEEATMAVASFASAADTAHFNDSLGRFVCDATIEPLMVTHGNWTAIAVADGSFPLEDGDPSRLLRRAAEVWGLELEQIACRD